MKNKDKYRTEAGGVLINFKKNKIRKAVTIVLSVVIVVLFIGISYSLWTYNFIGNKNIAKVEPVELELLESKDQIISITNAFPMSDKQGIEQTEAIDFSVTTRTATTTNIYYNLKIEKLSVDNGYTALSDDDIKIYLTDYDGKAIIAPRKIGNLTNYIFYKTYNKHTNETSEVTAKFKLKAWISEDVDASSWNENTRLQYKFKIGVSSNEYNSSLANLSNKTLPKGAYYGNFNWDTEKLTLYDKVPETVNEGDLYIHGDYIYEYRSTFYGGWGVLLATTESFTMFGLTEVLPDYPLVDLTRTSYAPILDNINGLPLVGMCETFKGTTALAEPPVIPKSVAMQVGIYQSNTSLKSDTNIYSIGNYITTTMLNSIENYTTEYKDLNKIIFLKHNIGSLGRIETQELCYILNGEKYCLKGEIKNYFEQNKNLLLETFGEENCSIYYDRLYCTLPGLRMAAYDDGEVFGSTTNWECWLDDENGGQCTEYDSSGPV